MKSGKLRAGTGRGDLASSNPTPLAAHERTTRRAALRVRLYFLFLLIDFIAISVAVLLATAARYFPTFETAAVHDTLPLMLPAYLALSVNMRAFQRRVLTDPITSVQRATFAFVAAVTAALVILFFLKASALHSRLMFAYLAVIGTFTVAIGRISAGRLARLWLGTASESVLVIADGVPASARHDAIILDAATHGLRPDVDNPNALDWLGRHFKGFDRVVVMCSDSDRGKWATALKAFDIRAEISLSELDGLGATGIGSYDDASTIVVGAGPLGQRDALVKRCFDVALTLLLLPFLIPIVLLVALAIKLDTPGPVLFAQTRVGQGNRHFQMLKFRSMRMDASDAHGRQSTRRDDDRITRVGKFIRATSLDELPQFWNVIKGEMSIVGPRPHALGSAVGSQLFWQIDERYWERHVAKPGLTGLAQVRGQRGTTETRDALAGRVQSDLEYIANWSVARDIRILLLTLRMLVHRNAY